MSEPAEALKNTSTAFAIKSDQFLKKETLKLVDREKGLKFFKGQCIVRVANRLVLRQKAYELIHYLYAKKGFTRDEDSDLWLSIYDAIPETATFVAEDDQGYLEGALTVVFDSHIGVPADALYQKELDVLRNSGGQICEFISLGIRNGAKNRQKILACLFYCAYLHAWHNKQSSNLVITVNPQHEKFYCRKLFFEKIGPERNFEKVNGAPSVLLNVPLTVYRRPEHKHRIFPLFMINYSDQKELETVRKLDNMVRPMTDEEFYTFFIDKTETWERALPRQKKFIRRAYPAQAINHHEVSRALAMGISRKNRCADDMLDNVSEAFH